MKPVCVRFCLLCVCALLVACAEDAPPTPQTGEHPRIITLAPALTQVLIDLGLADHLVGVSEYDLVAPEGLPVVGHYRDVDAERLLALRPTHVLMMVGVEGSPVRLTELSQQMGFKLAVFDYPDKVENVWTILADEQTGVGTALGVAERASRLREESLARLDTLGRLTGDLDRPRTLVVFSTQPNVMASGPRTVNDELIRIAGGQNAAGDAAVQAPEFGREGLLALNPDVIILLMPAAPELVEDDPRLAIFRGLPLPAVTEGRIYLINDPAALLPSTSIVRIATQMAVTIHPEIADRIDADPEP